MSDLGNYHVVPRKPVPNRAGSSLRIARSHSTLWRPWSPRLGSMSEYERSLHKFPWLTDESEYDNIYEDIEGGYSPVPQIASRLHDDSARDQDMAEVGARGSDITPITEHRSEGQEDYNLVSDSHRASLCCPSAKM